MARYTSKQTTIVLEDNVGTSITAGPGIGDFSIDGIEEDNAEAIQAINRGVHDGWVEGNDKIQAWSLTLGLKNEAMSSAGAARILDFIRKTNFFSGLQSVDSSVWAMKVIITMNDGTTTSTKTLPNNRVQVSMTEAVEGWTIALTGTNVVAPTFT